MFQMLRQSSFETKKLLIGVLLNSLGSGLTLPLLIVYLHQVRGLSVLTASLVVAYMSIFGLVATGAVGSITDRFGPRPVLIFGLFVEALAVAAWSLVHNSATAFVVGAFSAIGQSAIWAPQATMLTRMVDASDRQKIFGIQFMLLNLGLGLGGMFSAVIVDPNNATSFVWLYVIDACSFLTYLCIVLSLPNYLAQEEYQVKDKGGYRDLLADRTLVYFFFAGLLMLSCGYGSLDAGMAPTLTIFGHQSVKVLGPIWAVNTSVIVIGQLYFLKRIEGRSRSRMLQIVALLWAASWLLIFFAVKTSGLWPALIAAVSTAVFACGEMIWSPIGPAILNDLAPEHLRGRYNAVSSLSWSISGSLGPAFSGLMLNRGYINQWLMTLVLGCVVAFVLMGRLQSRLSITQDGRVG